MSAVEFERLPDDARVWVFGASRELDADEQARLLTRVDAFIAGWLAHGSPVVGGREMAHGRFLLVAADERATGVSGCSIDSLFHHLAAVESEMDLTLRDPSAVYWRDASGEVRQATRPEFRALAASGQVTDGSPVFDNTVATVGDLRAGRWERPLRDSWHARAFPLA